MLRFAWYGDDFTGASDTLATLASAGLRTVLFPRVPSSAQLARFGELDAIGLAGTARALSPADMRDELAPARGFFDTLRPPVTHYKCCSTFDSAPHVGNLVTGLQSLRTPAHQPWVPIVGGQPGLGRFCAFGELFATASAGGEVHRIDRHPTMSRHPVTPMNEADLRRHLALQGMGPVASIDLRRLDSASDAALDDTLDTHLLTGPDAVLFDVLCDKHLLRIGRLLWQRALRQPLLALGASSVAQALIAHWHSEGAAPPAAPAVAAATGPVFLMVGSQSPVTAAQVEAGAAGYEAIEIPASAARGHRDAVAALAHRVAGHLQRGRSVMARTAAPQPGGASPMEMAALCGHLLKRVLQQSPQVRRVGVAGGDTSSFALRDLSPLALGWVGSLAPGVPLLRMHADDPALDGVELMLKGGQMGPPEVFQRLLTG